MFAAAHFLRLILGANEHSGSPSNFQFFFPFRQSATRAKLHQFFSCNHPKSSVIYPYFSQQLLIVKFIQNLFGGHARDQLFRNDRKNGCKEPVNLRSNLFIKYIAAN